MSDKDRADIYYGIEKDVEFIAPSFIQDAKSVHEIRNYVNECIVKQGLSSDYIPPLIISKIESLRGLSNFQEILDASDGIMVARGDLGVEIPIHSVTNAQKEMIRACNIGKIKFKYQMQPLSKMCSNNFFNRCSWETCHRSYANVRKYVR